MTEQTRKILRLLTYLLIIAVIVQLYFRLT